MLSGVMANQTEQIAVHLLMKRWQHVETAIVQSKYVQNVILPTMVMIAVCIRTVVTHVMSHGAGKKQQSGLVQMVFLMMFIRTTICLMVVERSWDSGAVVLPTNA